MVSLLESVWLSVLDEGPPAGGGDLFSVGMGLLLLLILWSGKWERWRERPRCVSNFLLHEHSKDTFPREDDGDISLLPTSFLDIR